MDCILHANNVSGAKLLTSVTQDMCMCMCTEGIRNCSMASGRKVRNVLGTCLVAVAVSTPVGSHLQVVSLS